MIQCLQIHFLNEQIIIFDNDIDIITFLQNDHIRKIILTKFFTTNKQVTKAAANDERLNFDCRELLYQEFSIYMI